MFLEWNLFKRQYGPFSSFKLSEEPAFNQISLTVTKNVVKKITFDTKKEYQTWKAAMKMEIEIQHTLNQKYPNDILGILNYSVEEQVGIVNVYIVYDCNGESQPVLEHMNRLMGDQEKINLAEQILFIGHLLSASQVQHRNLKPSNLIVKQNKIYLTDFGSARTLNQSYEANFTKQKQKDWRMNSLYYNCKQFVDIMMEDNYDFREQQWQEYNQGSQRGEIYTIADRWAMGIIMISMFESQTIIPKDMSKFYCQNPELLVQKLDSLRQHNSKCLEIIEAIKNLTIDNMDFSQVYREFIYKNEQKKKVQKNTFSQEKQEDKQEFQIRQYKDLQKVDLNYNSQHFYLSRQDREELQKRLTSVFVPQQKIIRENPVLEEIDDEEQQQGMVLNQQDSQPNFKLSIVQFVQSHLESVNLNNEEQTKQLQRFIQAPIAANLLTNNQVQQLQPQQVAEYQQALKRVENKNLTQYQQNQIQNQLQICEDQVQNNKQGLTQLTNQPLQIIRNTAKEGSQLIQFDDSNIQNGIKNYSQQSVDLSLSQGPISQPLQPFNENDRLEEQYQVTNKSSYTQILSKQELNNLQIQEIEEYQERLTKLSQQPQSLQQKSNYQKELNLCEEIKQQKLSRTQEEIKQFNKQIISNEKLNMMTIDEILEQKDKLRQLKNQTTGQQQQIVLQQLQECETIIEQKKQNQNSNRDVSQFQKSSNNQQQLQQFTEENQDQQVKNQQKDSNRLYLQESEFENQQLQIFNIDDHDEEIQQPQSQRQNVIQFQQNKNESVKLSELQNQDKVNKQQIPQTSNQVQIFTKAQIKDMTFEQLQEYKEQLNRLKNDQQTLAKTEINHQQLEAQLEVITEIIEENSQCQEFYSYQLLNKQDLVNMNDSQLEEQKYRLEDQLKAVENENSHNAIVNQLRVINEIQQERQHSQTQQPQTKQIILEQPKQQQQKLQEIKEDKKKGQQNTQVQQKQMGVIEESKSDVLLESMNLQQQQKKGQKLERLDQTNDIVKSLITQIQINQSVQFDQIKKLTNDEIIDLLQKLKANSKLTQLKLIDQTNKSQRIISSKKFREMLELELKERQKLQKDQQSIHEQETSEYFPLMKASTVYPEKQRQQLKKEGIDTENISNQSDRVNQEYEIWSFHPLVKKFQIWKLHNKEYDEMFNIQFYKNYQYSNFQGSKAYEENQQYKFYGQMQDGKLWGLGKMMKKNKGGIYEGLFIDGEFELGLILEVNAQNKLQLYLGPYVVPRTKNNNLSNIPRCKHGKGLYIWFNENRGNFEEFEKYEGDIVCGKMRGNGVLFFKETNGRQMKYVGQWKDGQKCGVGKIYKQNPKQEYKLAFEGEFLNDKKEGEGIEYFDDYQQLRQRANYRNDKPKGVASLEKIGKEKVKQNCELIDDVHIYRNIDYQLMKEINY